MVPFNFKYLCLFFLLVLVLPKKNRTTFFSQIIGHITIIQFHENRCFSDSSILSRSILCKYKIFNKISLCLISEWWLNRFVKHNISILLCHSILYHSVSGHFLKNSLLKVIFFCFKMFYFWLKKKKKHYPFNSTQYPSWNICPRKTEKLSVLLPFDPVVFSICSQLLLRVCKLYYGQKVFYYCPLYVTIGSLFRIVSTIFFLVSLIPAINFSLLCGSWFLNNFCVCLKEEKPIVWAETGYGLFKKTVSLLVLVLTVLSVWWRQETKVLKILWKNLRPKFLMVFYLLYLY